MQALTRRPAEPDWPRPTLLPLPLRAFLAAAHRRALERAEGRVLDLSPPALGAPLAPLARLLVTRGASSSSPGSAPRSAEELLAEGPYDVVVSVLALAEVDDAAGRLAAIRRALRPDGRLVLVEPYRRTGWRGAVASASAPLWAAWSGLRVDHPVPALVRAAGFSIVSIERRTAPTLVPAFRSVVELTALPSATTVPFAPPSASASPSTGAARGAPS